MHVRARIGNVHILARYIDVNRVINVDHVIIPAVWSSAYISITRMC